MNKEKMTIRFVRLEINDYGVFKGHNVIDFHPRRTVISGECGSGKTTIAKMMYQRGAVPGITGHFGLTPSVQVKVEGDPHLIEEYREFIFLDCERALTLSEPQGQMLAEMGLGERERKTVEDEMTLMFHSILSHKPWKIEAHKNLDPRVMAMGERICLGYALNFAVRKVRQLSVPVVFDSPYGNLDIGLRRGFKVFLKGLSCQQILLGSKSELKAQKAPHYILMSERYHHSLVIKTSKLA
jgi:ABC-type glutathione transport system ATPase component